MENGSLKRFTRVLLLIFGIIVVQTYGAVCSSVKPIKKQTYAQGLWRRFRKNLQNVLGIVKQEAKDAYERVVNPELQEEFQDEAIKDNDADYESYTSDDAENQENSDQDDAAEDADQEDTQSDASQDEVVEPSSTDDEDDY